MTTIWIVVSIIALSIIFEVLLGKDSVKVVDGKYRQRLAFKHGKHVYSIVATIAAALLGVVVVWRAHAPIIILLGGDPADVEFARVALAAFIITILVGCYGCALVSLAQKVRSHYANRLREQINQDDDIPSEYDELLV